MVGGQVRTWFEHALLAVLVPFLAGTVLGASAVVPVASLVFIGFWGRELRNRRDHIRAGDWDSPEAGTGVTPRVDMWGDLVGPLTALCAYTLNMVVSS